MALAPRGKGGCGGKLGHSNMSHYEYTEKIKLGHKKRLRRESKKLSMEVENEKRRCRFSKQ